MSIDTNAGALRYKPLGKSPGLRTKAVVGRFCIDPALDRMSIESDRGLSIMTLVIFFMKSPRLVARSLGLDEEQCLPVFEQLSIFGADFSDAPPDASLHGIE